MTESEHIEELLIEADAYGLRLEVMDWAKKELEDNPKLRRVDAYELAFREWIK
jgi:hypothetical protein